VAKGPARFVPIDVLRGFVMVLMSIDHGSEVFNKGRVFSDSIMFWKPGTPLPLDQFLTRWMTHLCAPTFVFLAGASLAMSTESRLAAGDSPRTVDGHIAKRGLLLIAFEFLWMSWCMRSPGQFLGQVLYAIGASLLFMIPLRRLGDRALFAVGLGWIALGELVAGLLARSELEGSVLSGFLVTVGFFGKGKLIVAYPAFGWLSIMTLGWVLGRRLLVWKKAGADVDRHAARVLAIAGVIGLAVFGVVRGINGYGNMRLVREDGSLAHWLHVSKYPPSISFVGLELGVMALLLAALFAYSAKRKGETFGGPLLLIGQTALFYYLLHIHVLAFVGWITGWHDSKNDHGTLGLWSAYVFGLAIVAVLYPLCVWYRRKKAAHPRSLLQYV
jgi:uncharacterized membrane protein